MAYQIKSIHYQNNSRKILLQNINGPCPLLAAANALLLLGVITLSSECVRNGVASTDDVVNMLANRALLRSQQQSSSSTFTSTKPSSTTKDITDGNHNNESSHHEEYHLNEVLSILPTLQHGMDVNPQFTSPTSVEYTHNLAAFDILGVELVHGWLLDPLQDVDTCAVVEGRSYNELIELVICGNEVKREVCVGRLEELMVEKEQELLLLSLSLLDDNEGNDDETEVESRAQTDEGVEVTNLDDANNDNNAKSSTNTDDESQLTAKQLQQQQANIIEQEIADIRLKLEEASLQISRADVVNTFLTSTSHQLTYHGLEQLHNHIGNDALHVFFRNNHFGTITKNNGILYLLVTDLGYANTPEIVWEKLDSIDGNTEYVNEYFEKPRPRMELVPATGPTIDPALLLAQRSQAENDYQLAMALSRGDTNNAAPTTTNNTTTTTITTTTNNSDEEEGKLIEAAKELSLRTYHGETDATTVAVVADDGNDNSTTNHNNSQLDADHQMALAFQQQEEQLIHESEQLARQLQALDRQEAEQRQQQQRQRNNNTSNGRRQPPANGRPTATAETKAGCTIS